MGNYIVQADLDVYLSDADLIMLTDDDGNETIDTAIVNECIVAAESEVDSYLPKQYETPITGTIPETVKEWAVQLTTVRLHQRQLPVPSDIWELAVEVRRQLKLVNDGTISLDIGEDSPDESSDREAQFTSNTRQFDRANMTGSGW
jgi:phage gp36-like protein